MAFADRLDGVLDLNEYLGTSRVKQFSKFLDVIVHHFFLNLEPRSTQTNEYSFNSVRVLIKKSPKNRIKYPRLGFYNCKRGVWEFFNASEEEMILSFHQFFYMACTSASR